MSDPKIAIALDYAWGEAAPVVVASGKGTVAERIVEAAVAHEVPVRADADLARLLAETPVGTAIPAAAFLAVAQLLSFLYDVARMIGAQRASDAGSAASR